MRAEFTSSKEFYGWIALLGVILVYFSGTATLFYSYGIFLPKMRDELGWSMAAAGGVSTVFFLIHGIPGPLIGASIAKFGARKNIVVGNAIAVLGLIGMSQVTNIWQAYLFYGVLVGIGDGLGLYLACTTIANNWFIRRKGLALGLLLSAGGIGGFVLIPLMGRLIDDIGWHSTWLVLALMHGIIAVIAGGLLIRNKPEDMGQVPDGKAQEGSETKKTAPLGVYQTSVDWDTGQAMRKISTWFILAFSAANIFAIVTMSAHLVSYLEEEVGLSSSAAAGSLALVPGMSIVGRLMVGGLSSRIETRYMAAICFAAQIVAIVLIMNATASNMVPVYLYALLFGISYGGLVVALPTILGKYYGQANYPHILGRLMPVTTLVGASGPLIAGAIYDANGSYALIFTIILAMSTLGMICALLSRPPKEQTLTSMWITNNS